MKVIQIFVTLLILGLSCQLVLAQANPENFDLQNVQYSGIYPHLAMYNNQGECGVGAVVPWAGKLWVITYSEHMPFGGEDKLYSISPDLTVDIYPESVGGTPANRMIHTESNQLIIGTYLIDKDGKVRVIKPEDMPGRLTGVCRHLTEPEKKVYFFTMEEGLYEVDVYTLEVKEICQDGHTRQPVDIAGPLLPGYHGKGCYSSQGRLVVANNGEKIPVAEYMNPGPSGCLAQWDGQKWDIVERKQFCEVTGPGGIYGNASDDDPLWATGWDPRSIILKLLDGGKWYTYRLPKASYTYDARHGWHTEWPRIREINEGRLLMTMHGMFWDFPKTFSRSNTAGIYPRSSYQKIIGDFCYWNGQIVLGCDDASRFANPICGQANSNLAFIRPGQLDEFGPRQAFGGVWVNDKIEASEPSDPFLFSGFDRRIVHLWHDNTKPVRFILEIDEKGNNQWKAYKTISVDTDGYKQYIFPQSLQAEWIRVTADHACNKAGAYFHYTTGNYQKDAGLFRLLPQADTASAYSVGLIRPRGENKKTLHFAAWNVNKKGNRTEAGYYEIGDDMKLQAVDDPQAHNWLKEKAKVNTPGFQVDEASVLVVDNQKRRWRLPKGAKQFDKPFAFGWTRGIREVVTERSLFNCHGTFYELPRDTNYGMAGIKPVCTHNRIISDYCSWRGMLVLAGNLVDAKEDKHNIVSDDGKAGLWFGSIDDLWKFGKPQGHGGPWLSTKVKADQPSDPYLMTGFDHKVMTLDHDSDKEVEFKVEVDVTGQGIWHEYRTFTVKSGKKLTHTFDQGFSAHWVRVTANKACTATARFDYK